MKADVKVFLEKGGERKDMSVEKLTGKEGPRFWFKEKNPQPPQQQVEGKRDDQSVTEEVVDESVTEEVVDESTTEEPATEAPPTRMSEVAPDEIETGQKMWLS